MKNVLSKIFALLLAVTLSSCAVVIENPDGENQTSAQTSRGETATVVDSVWLPDGETCSPIGTLIPCTEQYANGVTLNAEVLQALSNLYTAVCAQGFTFTVTNGYYDFETAKSKYNAVYQAQTLTITSEAYLLFGGAYISANYAKKTSLSPSDAQRVARYVNGAPEKDEHQLGTLIDLDGLLGADALACFDTLASDYGFILRYPRGKENLTGRIANDYVYRFVGIETARYLKQNGLCLEELR